MRNNIILKDAEGENVTYQNIKKLRVKDSNSQYIDYIRDYKGKYKVKVIDYDGSIIDEQYLNTGDVYELPAEPTHDRLLFQSWSATETITNGTITVGTNDIMIGPVYTTKSGKNEIDVEYIDSDGGNKYLRIYTTGTVDWGDGTVTTTSNPTHYYTSSGKYTILCDSFTAVNGSGLFWNTSSGINSPSQTSIVACRFANLTSLGNYNLATLPNLKTLTFSNSLTSIGSWNFSDTSRNVTRISTLILPTSLTTISGNLCNGAESLKNVVIPKQITSLGNQSFSGCKSLSEIVIPNSLTTLPQYCISSTYIEKIKIPASITTINNYAFSYSYLCSIYDFSDHTSVPTLSSTNAFDGIRRDAKIIVPDSLYSAWTGATNWANFASYIVKASEVE